MSPTLSPTRLPNPAASRAVLIGCSRYTELTALPTVAAGLVDLGAALTDPITGGFTPRTCQVIINPASPAGLARTLLQVARAALDTLLIYYSGHGVLDERNNLHLALTGTSTDQALVPFTALAYEQLRSILLSSPARNRIVILDCCYAGGAIQDMAGPDLSQRAVVKGSYVLTATDTYETARATDGSRYTAFTGAFLDLLRKGLPQGPQLLTLETLYPYLRQTLVGRCLPEPRRQGTDETAAGLALIRNPCNKPPPAMPAATLTDQKSLVRGVAFSPDGALLAITGDDGTVQLWDVITGVLVGDPLTGHAGRVEGVAFSPDGTLLATSGGRDSTVRLWDVATQQLAGAALAGRIRALSVAFSPNGQLLATGSTNGTVKLWDVARRALLATFAGHTSAVRRVAFSPDGTLLVTASRGHDRTVRIWDVARRRALKATITGHTSAARGVAFHPDGTLIATTSDDGTILWDTVTWTPKCDPLPGTHEVAFSPDGTLLASSAGHTVQLWDVATHALISGHLIEHTSTVRWVAFSSDGMLLATATSRGAYLWLVAGVMQRTDAQLGAPQ